MKRPECQHIVSFSCAARMYRVRGSSILSPVPPPYLIVLRSKCFWEELLRKAGRPHRVFGPHRMFRPRGEVRRGLNRQDIFQSQQPRKRESAPERIHDRSRASGCHDEIGIPKIAAYHRRVWEGMALLVYKIAPRTSGTLLAGDTTA